MVPGRVVDGIVRTNEQCQRLYGSYSSCCVAGLKVSEYERLAAYDRPMTRGVNVKSTKHAP